jgi:hypothetical protein
METIKEKLRKIKALAERGVDGEAKAAQFQLEKLLAKYNLTIEDIFDNTLKPRKFKVGRSEKKIFIHTLAANIGDRYKNVFYYKGNLSEVFIELTDQEYIDFEQQFSFHKKQFKREMKKAIDQLHKAYCYKHDLFNKDSQPKECDESEMSLDEYLSIMGLANKLENVTFRKQLSSQF